MQIDQSTSSDRRYLTLLGFAKTGKDPLGRPTLLLYDEEGSSRHLDDSKPLIFSKKRDFPSNRVFDTVLNNEAETPVQLINILAEFDEDQFEENKKNIPTLGNWDDLEQSNGRGSMNPIGEPPPKP